MTWEQLELRKLEGLSYRTWSVTGRARAVEFTVECVDNSGVTFRKQNGKLQKVSRAATEHVLANWKAYKTKAINRDDLAANNFSTSYLFGLLHCVEEELSSSN